MKNKIKLGLLFGGKSIEHEVALQSAQNVLDALDRGKYDIFLIGIDKEGGWHWYDEGSHFQNPDDPESIALGQKKGKVDPLALKREVDVVFPILHGLLGEDGTVQGLLKLADLPFVGAGVLGSSVGMDKDVMKRLLRDGGMPLPQFFSVKRHEKEDYPFENVVEKLGLPFFVKPANAGSSIGVCKVQDAKEFDKAVEEAFAFDRKILIEEMIVGREIECSLLGNESPIASLPCEIIPQGEFQSYLSKYIDDEAAKSYIPAKLEPDEVQRVQEAAIKAYQLLCCEGFARVDTFLAPDGTVYLNEINTIPGLTNMSPYAKMWEASGLPFGKVVDQLIELAFDRYKKERQLVTSVDLKKQWIET